MFHLLKLMTLFFVASQKSQEISAQTTGESAEVVDVEDKIVHVAFWGDQYELSKDSTGLGGFSGLSYLFNQQDRDTIRLCTGDILYPNLLSNRDGGRHRIDILNSLKLDAVILGNHDLDGGVENARDRMSESTFPWLAANVVDPLGHYYTGSQQALLFKRNETVVGIFGLISETTPGLVVDTGNITFASIIQTAKKMVVELKSRGAEIIIAGTHMDPEEDERLALEVPEIDAILGGHDHSKMAKHIGPKNTLLIKPGQDAHYLAVITFHAKKELTKSLKIVSSWEFIINQNVPADPNILEKVSKYQQTLSGKNELIGRVDQDYDTLEENLRSKNSAFASMIAASLQAYGKTDLGFITGGAVRRKHVYKKGDPFTYEDAEKELPFGNSFTVIELSGKMLLKALEYGVSKVPESAGRFPQLSGVTYSFDVNQPEGSRVITDSVYIQGNSLDLDKLYSVATSNLLAEGGDGYVMFKKANILIPYSKDLLLVDIFANYVKNNSSMKLINEEDNNISTSDHQKSCSATPRSYRRYVSFFTDPAHNCFEEPVPSQEDVQNTLMLHNNESCFDNYTMISPPSIV